MQSSRFHSFPSNMLNNLSCITRSRLEGGLHAGIVALTCQSPAQYICILMRSHHFILLFCTSNILHCADFKFLNRSLQHDTVYIMYHMSNISCWSYQISCPIVLVHVASTNKLARVLNLIHGSVYQTRNVLSGSTCSNSDTQLEQHLNNSLSSP